MKRFKKIIADYIEDILILSGLTFMNIPCYMYKAALGIGVTGFILFLLGIYFTVQPFNKERR